VVVTGPSLIPADSLTQNSLLAQVSRYHAARHRALAIVDVPDLRCGPVPGSVEIAHGGAAA
jgi:hypothetical protein